MDYAVQSGLSLQVMFHPSGKNPVMLTVKLRVLLPIMAQRATAPYAPRTRNAHKCWIRELKSSIQNKPGATGTLQLFLSSCVSQMLIGQANFNLNMAGEQRKGFFPC